MILIDITFIIILLAGLYYGLRKGLISVVFSFAAVIIGILTALAFAPALGIYLKDAFNSNSVIIPFLAFTLIFIGVAVAMRIIAGFLTKILQVIQLNFINRIFGGVLGIALFAFTLSLMIWLFEFMYPWPQRIRENVILYPVIQPIAPKFVKVTDIFLPGMSGIIDRVEELFEKEEPVESDDLFEA